MKSDSIDKKILFYKSLIKWENIETKYLWPHYTLWFMISGENCPSWCTWGKYKNKNNYLEWTLSPSARHRASTIRERASLCRKYDGLGMKIFSTHSRHPSYSNIKYKLVLSFSGVKYSHVGFLAVAQISYTYSYLKPWHWLFPLSRTLVFPNKLAWLVVSPPRGLFAPFLPSQWNLPWVKIYHLPWLIFQPSLLPFL